MAETELNETQQRVAELSVALTSAVSDRRRLETELVAARGELEDIAKERADAVDRAARLQLELSRVVDELRQTEEVQRAGDTLRQRLEAELRDLAARLEAAETIALREGKRLVAKLQSKVSVHFIFHQRESITVASAYLDHNYCAKLFYYVS